ncbi:sensor histidine kinase [Sphingomonas oligophenolica]|uniref:Two-component regulator propeller domain-containing protein n=1 Tax=Sphingomonas oligophenolica TaxID=301154 RepID=A0ABU9Y3B8_9SPHN
MVRTIARLLSLSLLLAAVAAQALPADRTLGQMTHTRWTANDGTPAPVQALAQTRDGFLWIGSGTGLYRFDGLTFERITTIGPEISVTALLATRDGRLFAGFQNGHMLLLQHGRQTDVTPSVQAKYIRKIVEDRAGGIWAQTIVPSIALARYFDGRWTSYGPSRGISEDYLIEDTIATRDGSVWVLTQDAVQVMKPGTNHFETILAKLNDKIDGIFEDPNGRVWAAEHERGLWQIPFGGRPVSPTIALTDSINLLRRVFFDRDGAIWGSISSDGIFRITPSLTAVRGKQRIERFGALQGLSSDGASAILEDREGTIWVGTSGGLDRFRPANVVLEEAIPAKSTYGYGLFADRAGVVYVTDSETLYRVLPGGSPTAILKGINNPMSLCEGKPGDIWLAAYGTMYVVNSGGVRKLPPPALTGFMRCQGDQNHAPWFLDTLGNLVRRDGSNWVREVPAQRATSASRFTFDRQGRPLVFFEDKGLLRRDPAGWSMIWPAARIPGGRIGPLMSTSHGVMVGGVSGLARINGNRVDRLKGNNPWLQHVTGIAETSKGDTWIQTSFGVFKLRTADLQAAFEKPGTALRPTRFDPSDGLAGANLLDYADNGAAIGGDGRVWLQTTAGIVWIDPSHMVLNGVLPPIVITRMIADGRHVNDPSAVTLMSGTKNVEIDYTALSLAAPERVQFRYRMVGADDHWINPGARRQAFYQNLAPGRYAFTVIGANNDGVWNRRGATIYLTLPPTFLQSWPFKLLCAGAALLLLWMVYKIRLGRITARLREQLETRLVERERIARELHDTLLQGVHGLILRFQGIADRLPREQVPGRLMEKALERAEELLVEGRERVHGLRSVPMHFDFKSAIAEMAGQASLSPDTTVGIRESGVARSIDPVVQEEVVGVVREALSNVARHAGASAVDIRIAHHWNRLVVSVADNGTWAEDADKRAKNGRHFGMIGMRERARRIGGTLKVQPGIGKSGTRITVTVPARVAYHSHFARRIKALLGIRNIEPTT